MEVDEGWDVSKENFAPVRGGRQAAALHRAPLLTPVKSPESELEEERRRVGPVVSSGTEHIKLELSRRHKQALFSRRKHLVDIGAAQDDPLPAWLRYVKWTQEAYPAAGGKAELLRAVEAATKALGGCERYYEDPRFLRLWIQYADCLPDPSDVFVFLQNRGIGRDLALLYEAHATFLELKGAYPRADAVYQEGLDRMAKPLDRLKQKHAAFQRRMAKRLQRQTQEAALGMAPAGDEGVARGALRDLRAAADDSPALDENGQRRAARPGRAALHQPTLPGVTGVRGSAAARLPPNPAAAAASLLGGRGPAALGALGVGAAAAGLDAPAGNSVDAFAVCVDEEFVPGRAGVRPAAFPPAPALACAPAALPALAAVRKENAAAAGPWVGTGLRPQDASMAPLGAAKLEVCPDDEFLDEQRAEEEAAAAAAAAAARARLERQQMLTGGAGGATGQGLSAATEAEARRPASQGRGLSPRPVSLPPPMVVLPPPVVPLQAARAPSLATPGPARPTVAPCSSTSSSAGPPATADSDPVVPRVGTVATAAVAAAAARASVAAACGVAGGYEESLLVGPDGHDRCFEEARAALWLTRHPLPRPPEPLSHAQLQGRVQEQGQGEQQQQPLPPRQGLQAQQQQQQQQQPSPPLQQCKEADGGQQQPARAPQQEQPAALGRHSGLGFAAPPPMAAGLSAEGLPAEPTEPAAAPQQPWSHPQAQAQAQEPTHRLCRRSMGGLAGLSVDLTVTVSTRAALASVGLMFSSDLTASAAPSPLVAHGHGRAPSMVGHVGGGPEAGGAPFGGAADPTVTLGTREALNLVNGLFCEQAPGPLAEVTQRFSRGRPSGAGGLGLYEDTEFLCGGAPGAAAARQRSRRSSVAPGGLGLYEDTEFITRPVGGGTLGAAAARQRSRQSSVAPGSLGLYEDTEFITRPVGGAAPGGSGTDEAAADGPAPGGLGMYEDTEFVTRPAAPPAGCGSVGCGAGGAGCAGGDFELHRDTEFVAGACAAARDAHGAPHEGQQQRRPQELQRQHASFAAAPGLELENRPPPEPTAEPGPADDAACGAGAAAAQTDAPSSAAAAVAVAMATTAAALGTPRRPVAEAAGGSMDSPQGLARRCDAFDVLRSSPEALRERLARARAGAAVAPSPESSPDKEGPKENAALFGACAAAEPARRALAPRSLDDPAARSAALQPLSAARAALLGVELAEGAAAATASAEADAGAGAEAAAAAAAAAAALTSPPRRALRSLFQDGS